MFEPIIGVCKCFDESSLAGGAPCSRVGGYIRKLTTEPLIDNPTCTSLIIAENEQGQGTIDQIMSMLRGREGGTSESKHWSTKFNARNILKHNIQNHHVPTNNDIRMQLAVNSQKPVGSGMRLTP